MSKKMVAFLFLMVLLTKPVGAMSEMAAKDPLSLGIDQYQVARELFLWKETTLRWRCY